MKLRYTSRAKLDLAEIHDYISQENPQAAKRVICLSAKRLKRYLKTLKSAGWGESLEHTN